MDLREENCAVGPGIFLLVIRFTSITFELRVIRLAAIRLHQLDDNLKFYFVKRDEMNLREENCGVGLGISLLLMGFTSITFELRVIRLAVNR